MACLFLLSAGCASLSPVDVWVRTDSNDDVRIHFLQFDVDTIPISQANIEKRAACVIQIDQKDALVEVIRKLIENQMHGDFDDRLVRVKIEHLVASDVFVDMTGGVLVGKWSGRMSRESFEALQRLLNKIAPWERCHR